MYEKNKPGATCVSPFTDTASCFFTRPLAGTFSTQGIRNAFYNPGDMNHNLGLFKNFALSERHTVQFRFEAFNWINHPNWNGVASTNPTNANFLRVNDPDNWCLKQSGLLNTMEKKKFSMM